MSSRMRMVFPYPGGRNPQNPDQVSFKASKEFKLKDYVREKSNLKMSPCLFEMSLVFTCLKENDFNETLCFEEVERFNTCYVKALKEQHAVKMRKLNLTKSFTSENLLPIEVNQIILKYKLKQKK